MKKIYALLTSALIAAGLRAQTLPTVSKETQPQPEKPASMDTLVKPKTAAVSRKSGEGQKEFLKTGIKETVTTSKSHKIATDSKLSKDSKLAVDSKLSKDSKLAVDSKLSKDTKMVKDHKTATHKIVQPELKMHKEAGKIGEIKKAEIKK